MKKLLAILVTVALLVSCVTAFGVYAAHGIEVTELPVGVYPESEHDYPHDFYHRWIYTHPTEAEGLFVTFSEETSLDEEYRYLEENGIQYVTYDEIYFFSRVYNPWDDFVSYRGNELSGKTVYIPGNQFELTMNTDSEGTAYGFSIDRISVEPPENETLIRYHVNDTEKVDYYGCFGDGEAVIANANINGESGYAFSGWSTEPGGKAGYVAYDTLEAGKIHDLYAVWTKLLIEPEDTFNFSNGSVGYIPPADDNYYMTDEHFDMMIGNLFKNFGLGPIPGPIVAAVLSTYPSWSFRGSCYGMSASVFLNYHGIDEFLKVKGAEHLSEIRPDGEVVSMVNYYQAQAASSYLCENLAPFPGTAVYSEQLKNMYETVKDGNPVLFSYYSGKYLIESGHTVVLTGAFEDAGGNKFIVAYDSNNDYCSGQCHYYRISPDFTSISDSGFSPIDGGYQIKGFNWTADYEQFTSFDINGEGNPLVWYKIFFGHIFYWMQTVFSAVFSA
ncbi:MAG: hypothetical protein IJD78_09940 [Clostridia bacterium]|nr:hypothetical protein [Clostridia bacterium]